MKIDKKFRIKIILVVFLILLLLLILPSFFSRGKRPNVILITMDALRLDHLGCYGYNRNTSPSIDKVAAGGTIFINAVAQSSFTAPCMTSILTSTYPPTHGVVNYGYRIINENCTLSYLLRTHGYETAFISNHGGIIDIKDFENNFNIFYPIGRSKENKNINIAKINSKIIKWINKNKNKRFFLWVHCLEPHYPMNPSLDYRNLLSDSYMGHPAVNVPISNNHEFGFGGIPRRLAKINRDITDLNYYINLYDQTIRYADDFVGDLMENLNRLHLDKKTLIIISADHGESLGEHNQYFTHGFNLYNELIKIPLIMKLPEVIPQGKRIIQQVQQVDIAPTVLEILGIRHPDGIDGASLLSLLKEPDLNQEKYAFSFVGNKIAIMTNFWKLIYDTNSKEYELYNLSNDPKELNNLALAGEKQFELLKDKLEDYLKQVKHDYNKEEKVILDKETKERLRSLGYIE